MAEQTQMSVALPSTIVEDIVKAEIIRNLGHRDELVAAIIGSAMSGQCKCDKHRYGSPKATWLACELERQIEQVCKDIIAAWVSDQREKFKTELQKRLMKPEQMRHLVSSFAEGIVAGSWKVHVDLKQGRD
jgi:hypothetical protein